MLPLIAINGLFLFVFMVLIAINSMFLFVFMVLIAINSMFQHQLFTFCGAKLKIILKIFGGFRKMYYFSRQNRKSSEDTLKFFNNFIK